MLNNKLSFYSAYENYEKFVDRKKRDQNYLEDLRDVTIAELRFAGFFKFHEASSLRYKHIKIIFSLIQTELFKLNSVVHQIYESTSGHEMRIS